MTEASDVDYDDLFAKHKTLYCLRHQKLGEQKPHMLGLEEHLRTCWEEALRPMIEQLHSH